MQPVELNVSPERELIIRWTDDRVDQIPLRVLREHCQCAGCNEKRINPTPEKPGELRVLSAAEARPLEIEKMHPVGNYAYNVHFSDGHSAGIYTFEMLRRIGEIAAG